MLVGKRIRLIPTEEQEILFRKSAGIARWSWNYFLNKQIEHYCLFKQGLVEKSYIKEGDIRKEITQLKKLEEYNWLGEVKDADLAFKRFFNKTCNYPKFKKKG